MADSESRALAWAASILLVASLARFGWARLGSEPSLETAVDPSTEMLASSRRSLEEQEARSRPLSAGERIDPNRATAVELDRLPGIGPAAAEAIVRSREHDGPFRSAEDLVRVRGVGPSTVARIAPHLDVTATAPVGGRAPGALGRGPIDLNRADEPALRSLPGIGPALARRIVEARAAAPFRSVGDLRRVKGIGPSTLARLEGLVTVRPR